MADGVALAAAVKEGDASIGWLVFVVSGRGRVGRVGVGRQGVRDAALPPSPRPQAIMLHKAPSSFGLTSYLLHAGMSRPAVTQVRRRE